MKVTSIFILSFFISLVVQAQHQPHAEATEHHSMKGAHVVSIGIGHTHISEGRNEGSGKSEWMTMPSWSLNYEYWISNKWAIGLQNDIILESYVVEHGDAEILEREYPLAIVPVGMFKPGKHFAFVLGAGSEIAGGHNIGLTRLGVEYNHHLQKNWEVGVALVWDNKWNYYNSWGISAIFSKILPKKHPAAAVAH